MRRIEPLSFSWQIGKILPSLAISLLRPFASFFDVIFKVCGAYRIYDVNQFLTFIVTSHSSYLFQWASHVEGLRSEVTAIGTTSIFLFLMGVRSLIHRLQCISSSLSLFQILIKSMTDLPHYSVLRWILIDASGISGLGSWDCGILGLHSCSYSEFLSLLAQNRSTDLFEDESRRSCGWRLDFLTQHTQVKQLLAVIIVVGNSYAVCCLHICSFKLCL